METGGPDAQAKLDEYEAPWIANYGEKAHQDALRDTEDAYQLSKKNGETLQSLTKRKSQVFKQWKDMEEAKNTAKKEAERCEKEQKEAGSPRESRSTKAEEAAESQPDAPRDGGRARDEASFRQSPSA